jgi:alpha-L-arabinofuranosidase
MSNLFGFYGVEPMPAISRQQGAQLSAEGTPGRTPLKNPRQARWLVESLEQRLLCAGTPPAVPVPVAHWAFDDGSGTTAVDSSGNSHTGTLGSGVSWVTGNVGASAVSLNGTSSAVVTANGPVVNTAGSFTVSAWVDLASLSGYQTIVSIAGNNVAGFYLQLRGDTGTFAFSRLSSDADGTPTYVDSPTNPVIGTWYQLVGVDDAAAGTMTLYVDGQSMGTTAFTSGWAATGNTLIGQGFYSGAATDFTDGSIDDVQLFSSALSAAQVVALAQPADYPFEEGTGTTSADYSGHGKTLTLNSGASWAPGIIGPYSLAMNGTATGNATFASPVVNTALPFSVSAWVKLNSLSGFQTFVSIDGTNDSGFYLQFTGDTQHFAFARVSSDTINPQSFRALSSSSPSVGIWYNLIGVNDVATNQLLLYVDGVLQSTTTYQNGWTATGATVIGGGKYNGVRTDFVNGDIDDVVFYNSPLNAADANYIGTAGSSMINIATGTTGATVSPDLFGAFLEDINYSGEGGIYNDEVRNSGFNDSTGPLNGWAAVASSSVKDTLTSDTTTGPTGALTQSGALSITSGVSATARAGISNSGYVGVAVAPSTAYTVEFYAKATANFTGPLTVDLESTSRTIYATATISSVTTAWAPYTVTLTTGVNTPTTATNLFVISTTSPSANGATIWFGATYLYPPSYEGAANHLRIDLMQYLAELKPAVFRVPGGNFLEGNDYATRFEWSNTIGPVQDRPGHYNSAWGYWTTDGLGLDEFLQMAEEVGAQPILAVYAGYNLGGTSDTGTVLADYVTNAVDELHYVLDPVTTAWGAERAANGHPAPYNIQDVEIGNEDFFSSTYSTRYPLFYNAIHAAFPSLLIIATSSDTGGSPYNVLDEHFYQSPQWFETNSNYFDNTPRGSSTIFIGEYASNQGSPTPNMASALGDTSWLLGLERNSDLVTMSAYAPLFVNVGAYQWGTNLIGFNNTSAYGSPSYWAQVMLGENHGTTVISDSVNGMDGLQTLVTRTGSTYYLTVINTLATSNTTTVDLSGVTAVSSTANVTSLTGTTASATNSITDPNAIVPETSTLTGLGTSFTDTFPGFSITILQFTADSAPTVATAAAATPNPVTGRTTNLSVLGADTAGEGTLTYTWSAKGPAGVGFSSNGTNAAKNTTATFTAAGTYTFTVTIENQFNQTVTSTVTVVVNQTLTSIAVAPTTASIFDGQTSQFTATALDQFGMALLTQPVFTWTLNAGAAGSLSQTGLYTAPATGPAAVAVSAYSGTVSGSAAVTVILSVIDGTAGNDTIRLVRSSANLLIYIDSSSPTYTVPFASLGSLLVEGGAGTDTLNIDFSGGATPVPAGGITVNGSGGTDSLIITGNSQADAVVVNSTSISCDGSAISYSNVQTIIFDGNGGADSLTQTAQPGNAAGLIFNSGTTGGPSALDSLEVSGGIYTFAAPPTGGGFAPIPLASLQISSGATVSLATAPAASDRSVLVLGALSISGSNTKLNLGGNDLLLHNAGSTAAAQSLAAVSAELASGYDAAAEGTWNGSGISSSAASATTPHLTALGVMLNSSLSLFDGQSVTSTDVLVKYTYYGDANLDGKVDGSDYARIDNGYLTHATGWNNGDFNYDGVINGSDYTLIDNAFNIQGAAIPSASVASMMASTAQSVSQPKNKTPAKPVAFAGNQLFSDLPVSQSTLGDNPTDSTWEMLSADDSDSLLKARDRGPL